MNNKRHLYHGMIAVMFSLTTTGVAAQVPYKQHVNTARGFGMPVLKNKTQVKAYASKKKLKAVAAKNKGYKVAPLTHSHPYLVPQANKVLNEIAAAFHKKSGKSTFTVTSITRTVHDQERLRRVNSNATKDVSAHNYGCSFDISYIRFNNKKAPNARLEKILNTVLSLFQNQGKIYFIKEYKEKCFHITVRS